MKSNRILDEIERSAGVPPAWSNAGRMPALPFIVNYDIKYRLGRGGEEETE